MTASRHDELLSRTALFEVVPARDRCDAAVVGTRPI